MIERRVLVGEHNAVFREAVRRVLALEPSVKLVTEASTANDTIRDAVRAQPDIAILDVHLPDRNGIELAGEIRSKVPQARVILLLDEDEDLYRAAATRQGATFAVKDRLVDELPAAIAKGSSKGAQGPATDMKGEFQMSIHVNDSLSSVKSNPSFANRANGDHLAYALRSALAIFLIGALLLTAAACLSSQFQLGALERSAIVAPDGTSFVVDDLGLLGRAGATVRLNPVERDEYFQRAADARQTNLAICVGIGFLGLAISSLLVGWLQAKDAVCDKKKLSVFSPPGSPAQSPASDM